jgi:hypothetical protein
MTFGNFMPERWRLRLERTQREDRVYKPAALLVALDLMDEGLATPERIPLALLSARFDDLLLRAGLLGDTRAPGRAFQPLFYLSTSRATARRIAFWQLLQRERVREDIDAPNSVTGLLRHADTAALLEPLREDARTREGRQRIRWAIYSVLEQDGAADSDAVVAAHDTGHGVVLGEFERLRDLEQQPFRLDDVDAAVVKNESFRVARDRALRRLVLELYGYACALCEVRIRWGGRVEAEAAHIKPRALFGVDDVRNALALCRTHHWAFDAGLWTAEDDLAVRVHQEPVSERYDLAPLLVFAGRGLRPPSRPEARPHAEALRWHRAVTFAAARASAVAEG